MIRRKDFFFEDHRKTILTDPAFARLRSFKNVLITGHQAFLTHEALAGIADTTFRSLDSWAAGQSAATELYLRDNNVAGTESKQTQPVRV